MKLLPPVFLALFILTGTSRGDPLPIVTHLSLRMHVHPSKNTFTCEARSTILNTTGTRVEDLPFVLYRLFMVDGIEDDAGSPLRFSQAVTSFEDEKTLQANHIVIRLPDLPGASVLMKTDGLTLISNGR